MMLKGIESHVRFPDREIEDHPPVWRIISQEEIKHHFFFSSDNVRKN